MFDEVARRAGAALRRPAPEHGVRTIARRHRRQQTLKTIIVGGVTVAALIGTLAVATNRNDPDSLTPVDPPPATLSASTTPTPKSTELAPVDPSPATVPAASTPVASTEGESAVAAEVTNAPSGETQPIEIDHRSWPTYTSTRYRTGEYFTVGHPPDWTEVPSSRDWSWQIDVRDPLSAAHEAFISPDNAIRVSAWNAPFEDNSVGLRLQRRPCGVGRGLLPAVG